jgi:hypothetical protein
MEGEGTYRITQLDDGNALGERKPAGNLCATLSSNASSSRTPSSTAQHSTSKRLYRLASESVVLINADMIVRYPGSSAISALARFRGVFAVTCEEAFPS